MSTLSVSFTFLLFVLAFGSLECAIKCQEDTCDTLKCEHATPETCNKPNQDLRKGGFCNCCTVCFTTLQENEECHVSYLLGGPPATTACKDGLECKNHKCQKVHH
ncbi:hypothetical protein WA026_008450 [Henosepilachna vigintioctopunctata]|uniref:Uncharacterized protein n=1 Tax=Henosepilachna vigintioctopunctata TaxID=420089 RepID=A0AAW1UBN4_9CUCU